MSEHRKVYVIRYWQTEGILVVDANTDGPFLLAYRRGATGIIQKKDWAATLELAQDRIRDKAASMYQSIVCSGRSALRRRQCDRLKQIAAHGAKVVEVKA